MKKILIMLLLIIVSSIRCISIAQEVSDDDKQKIIDYINCFYTKRYVLSESAKTTEREKQVIKKNGIDTVSVEYAYRYVKLDSILKTSNLRMTADNLTTKLNERNREINSSNIFDFVDDAVDTGYFENFKFTRKDECDVRNAILTWWYRDKDIRQEKNKSGSKDENPPLKDNKGLPYWVWLSLGLNAFIILWEMIMALKSRGNNEIEVSPFQSPKKDEYLRLENDKLKIENRKLKEELREKGDKREENTVVTAQDEINDGLRCGTEISFQKDIEKVPTSTTGIVFYADVDVNNNLFVRTYEKCIKKSIYVIDANQHTFTLIDDEQLYEDNLSRANSSGILGACEVSGTYKKGKRVSITPGKVQQEENGKWRIINKAIIEIK